MVYKKASILFITQNIKKYVYNVIHYALICFSGGYKSTGYANVLLIVKPSLDSQQLMPMALERPADLRQSPQAEQKSF